MGPPVSQASVGQTEVWQYQSGGSITNAGRLRYCTLNVTFSNGAVSAIGYSGPTGTLTTPDSECAYAVQACL